ncbi:hypothetical protein VCSRO97_3525 [Vibrio cholerae]|nr:hypothetical protein VCSRO97_3525 [Vibrio cholerae]
MKKLIMVVLLMMPFHLSAVEATKNEIVKELVVVMDMDSMMDSMRQHIENSMLNVQQQLNVTESEKPLFEEYYKNVNKLVLEEVTWGKFEPYMISIYSNHFSEEELKGMIDFYSSDVGQSILKKMPVVMQESMLMSQSMLQRILPQMQTLTAAFESELKAHRNK